MIYSTFIGYFFKSYEFKLHFAKEVECIYGLNLTNASTGFSTDINIINPILLGPFNQSMLRWGGSKMPLYQTPKAKVMRIPNLACG